MISEDTNTNYNNCFKLDFVTPEQIIYSDFVNNVSAPGVDGEMGILPHHSPLITLLQPGVLRIRKGSEEIGIAVGGGFLDVRRDSVIILADAAERDESIDAQKAAEAIQRAQQRSSNTRMSAADKAPADASLRFELARLRVAEKQKKKKGLRHIIRENILN
jgi:F-type H+-transporting ATPase subunit epsilon